MGAVWNSRTEERGRKGVGQGGMEGRKGKRQGKERGRRESHTSLRLLPCSFVHFS